MGCEEELSKNGQVIIWKWMFLWSAEISVKLINVDICIWLDCVGFLKSDELAYTTLRMFLKQTKIINRNFSNLGMALCVN